MSDDGVIKLDNVIPFQQPTITLSIKATSQKPLCRHNKVELDSDFRMIRCKQCGGQIEPFDWIKQYANRERNLKWEFENLQEKQKRLTASIKELNAEEKRLRARVSRLKRKPE